MEEDEQSLYVAQLQEEFSSCDTTGTGYLDKEELTVLCHKLHLEAHLPLLLGILLGSNPYARVNFEEFKEGFVAVLSQCLDLSTSEEETSYLEPAVPEEVKPKFVKGTKRYGRRSRPDRLNPDQTANSGEAAASLKTDQSEPFGVDVQRTRLKRSTSLESVESLKSDEETGSNKEQSPQTFEAQGQLKKWKQDGGQCPPPSPGLAGDQGARSMRTVWAELGVDSSGFLDRQELSLVCDNISMKDRGSEELDAVFRKLDEDRGSRVGLKELQRGVVTHGGGVAKPTSCSTPIRSHLLHKPLQVSVTALEESSLRSTSPSILTATVGQRILSQLDDGSGYTSPEHVVTLWNEEGIKNSSEVLQTLDFSLDDRLSLADLTLALDNELLVSGNGIHQAALVSYKSEVHFLQVQAEQVRRERDKAKADLERAEKCSLQLVHEVEEHHATVDKLNRTKIRDLEQGHRTKLAALQTEMEEEAEALLRQEEQERARLQEEVATLRAQEAALLEEVTIATQENARLEKEVSCLSEKLLESESIVSKLQKDLDQLLQDKFAGLSAGHSSLLGQEERFADIIKEYEQQCRELRDRNDELNAKLETLKTQGSTRRSRRVQDSIFDHSWSSRQPVSTESDSDDQELKTMTSPLARKKLQVADDDPANVSIETELALEKLKERHSQELQDLKIELETKVNFYERSLELMRQNMEVERKDISQSFKLEISELEEQRVRAEEREARLQEGVAQLRAQLQAAAWGPEQERRVQREHAELEQSYARDISSLVQRLTSERERAEAELQLRMEREVQLVRAQLDEVVSESSTLKDRHSMMQQEIQRLEEEVTRKKNKLVEAEKDHEQNREEVERLYKENAQHREEALELSNRNLQLSGENAELSARLRLEQEAVRRLTESLEGMSQEREETAAAVRELRETSGRRECERLQLQAGWQHERQALEGDLEAARRKLQQMSTVEADLAGLTMKHQYLEQEKQRLLKEVEERTLRVEQLQDTSHSLRAQMDQIHSELQAASLEKALQAQDVVSHQKMLQEARDKVQELEARIESLHREKEQLSDAHRQQEEEESQALKGECQSLRCQNQDMLLKVSQMQLQETELQRVTQESQMLKAKQVQLDKDLHQAQDQCVQANMALALAQSQHERELNEVKEHIGQGVREQLAQLHGKLAEEKQRSLQLEEQLDRQAQQASVQMTLQQEQYEKTMTHMEQKMEEAEAKVKNLRMVLQEKANQLTEQLSKDAKADMLLKGLYQENAELVKALQVTERRQKVAERKNYVLEEKVVALSMLLRRIAPISFST